MHNMTGQSGKRCTYGCTRWTVLPCRSTARASITKKHSSQLFKHYVGLSHKRISFLLLVIGQVTLDCIFQ